MKLGEYEKVGDKYLVQGELGDPYEFNDQCNAMLFSRMIRPSKDDGKDGARKKYDLTYIKEQKEV